MNLIKLPESNQKMRKRFTEKSVFTFYLSTAFLVVMLASTVELHAMFQDTILKTRVNVPVELTFTAERNYPDPANQVIIDVIFTDPKGRELRVPGYWNGNSRWKARYSSPIPGTHRFRSVCSETGDSGLNGISGKVIVRVK